MRRRLKIRKRLQRLRTKARRVMDRTGRGASTLQSFNFCLISAGLTDPFPG